MFYVLNEKRCLYLYVFTYVLFMCTGVRATLRVRARACICFFVFYLFICLFVRSFVSFFRLFVCLLNFFRFCQRVAFFIGASVHLSSVCFIIRLSFRRRVLMSAAQSCIASKAVNATGCLLR